ncbi:hypothetical protein RB195_000208 [Necator americanus]|uniref:Uncharacterized protein n=1 Tax=Necator americanus TaxID=51031 RepID=A0ABR1D8I3_NECAM
MHPSTLFLLQFLVTGSFASPLHNAFRRSRRDGNTQIIHPGTALREGPDLPPLPLEYEAEDEIYMSIDDPRVGTVDADGNVLVPVDDEGRILPGFEHLVRPLQIQMDVGDARNPQITLDSTSMKVLEPATSTGEVQSESDKEGGNDETVYDEEGDEQQAEQLPTASDYVDSREDRGDSEMARSGKKVEAPRQATKLNLTDFDNRLQPGDALKNDLEAADTTKNVDEKIEEVVHEIFTAAKEIDDSKIGADVGQKVDDELTEPAEESKESDSSKNIGDESQLENKDIDSISPGQELDEDDDETGEQNPLEPYEAEFDSSEGGATELEDEDSLDEDSPNTPNVGEGVEEIGKVLPKDDEKESGDEENKRLDHLRKGSMLGFEGGDKVAAGKPDSAPPATVFTPVLIIFLFSLYMM